VTVLLAAGAVALGLAWRGLVSVHDRDTSTPLPPLRQRNREALLFAGSIALALAAVGSLIP
jgi:hypothetical protein